MEMRGRKDQGKDEEWERTLKRLFAKGKQSP